MFIIAVLINRRVPVAVKKEKKKHLRALAEKKKARQLKKSSVKSRGIIKITKNGFGFVIPDDGSPDIFVPVKMVNSAIDGDLVEVELLPARDEYDSEKGPAGRVVNIIERTRQTFVGELLAGNRIRALNPHLPENIVLFGSRHGAERGSWVKFRLDELAGGVWRGSVVHPIGKTGVISADLDAVMEEYKIPPRYTAEEDRLAMEITPAEIERTDRRELAALTIDPVDAKDFDDALSVVPGFTGEKITVGVHISDVAAYIPHKSCFDRSAAERGFSCYLPGRTLPMLPAALTAKISLQENRESLAHTVFLDIDRRSGKVVSARREHSLIKVVKRLDYPTVQQFYKTGKCPADWSSEVKESIALLLEVSAAMRKYRAQTEEFIELPLPEVRVLCQENSNEISGIERKISAEAEELVEEFMLAANNAVGAELCEKHIPGIFRVHPFPEPEKTVEFCEMMSDAFKISCGDISNRTVCNEFVRSLPDDPRREVILSLLLRSMSRAAYSEKNEIHFALGKSRYCHFTSPIRRYPDLTVHQQLWNADSKKRLRSASSMEKIAADTSAKEENNDNAFYAANDRLKLRLLMEKLEAGENNFYEGVISKVVSSGLQVMIPEFGIYGFIPLEMLNGRFNRDRNMIKSVRGDVSYKLGDFIYLRLAGIDFARGNAEFAPAGRR